MQMALFGRRRGSYSRRNIHHLVITLIIIAGGLALFYLVRVLFFGGAGDIAKAFLSVPPRNTVYVQINGEDQFQSVSTSNLPFLENEIIQSRNTTLSSLTFFDDSKVFLDSRTEIVLQKSRLHSGEAREIELGLEIGQIWAEVTPSLNPRSRFAVQLSDSVILETKNGNFAINTETQLVKVAKGEVRLILSKEGSETFLIDIDVGQQFSFAGDVAQNSIDIVEEDPWFMAHREGLTVPTSPEDVIDTDDDTTDDDTDSDTTAPHVQILVPGKNSATVYVNSEPQEISGLVRAGTVAVEVDDYRLTQFEAGDTTFKYTASVAFDNLEVGRNEYTVKALNANDAVLGEATIVVIYDPEGNFEDIDEEENDDADTEEGTTEDEDTEETIEDEDESEEEVVTGEFAITAPNEGEDYTAPDAEGVDITGTAPSNAADVVIDGYTLSQFEAGDETWIYRVRRAFENMEEGENIYTARVLDAAGNVLAEDSITITFPEFPAEEVEEEEPAEETENTETSEEEADEGTETEAESSGTVTVGDESETGDEESSPEETENETSRTETENVSIASEPTLVDPETE